MAHKIVLEKVRCSYVFIAEEREKDGEKNGYGIQPLIPKNHPQYKALRNLELKALEEYFGKDAVKRKGRYKLPIRDGDEELESGAKDGDEYKNSVFLNANSYKKQPGIGIVRNKRVETADEDDIEELCYSGAYFTVSLSFYKMKDNKEEGGKPGLAVGVNNVLLVKKGKRLDGSLSAQEDFAGIKAEDYDDLDDDEDFDDEDDDLDDW